VSAAVQEQEQEQEQAVQEPTCVKFLSSRARGGNCEGFFELF
jgi:hypothetical protein